MHNAAFLVCCKPRFEWKHMRRRAFITFLGGAAAAWPLAARAQQPPMPVVGFVRDVTPDLSDARATAFRQALKEAGFVEGQNVAIEYRSEQTDRLPLVVADLLRAGGQGRNHDGADRLCDRGRSGQGWPRRQPQPAWWQRHRYQLHVGGACGEAAWAFA